MSVDSTNTLDAAVKYSHATRRAQELGVDHGGVDGLGRVRERRAEVDLSGHGAGGYAGPVPRASSAPNNLAAVR